jgi:hypothetical protein
VISIFHIRFLKSREKPQVQQYPTDRKTSPNKKIIDGSSSAYPIPSKHHLIENGQLLVNLYSTSGTLPDIHFIPL